MRLGEMKTMVVLVYALPIKRALGFARLDALWYDEAEVYGMLERIIVWNPITIHI